MACQEPSTPLPEAVSLVTPGCVEVIIASPKTCLESLVPMLDAIGGWGLLRGLQVFLERDNGTPTLFLSPFLE